MARLLEDLQPGTAVFDDSGHEVGAIRGVYASGAARGAEFLLVYWKNRDREALVPADEVMDVSEEGVRLVSSGASYDTLAAYDPAANPLLHRL